MGNGEEKRFLADNKSLIGLGLFVVLCLFGAIWLGEAVESEYGILSAAEDSSAQDSILVVIDNPTDEP